MIKATKNIFSNRWVMPLVWQVFIVFYFIRFIIAPLPFEGMWLSILMLLIFWLAYFWGFHQTDNKRVLAAIVMIICGIIAAPYNWGASTFFYFASFFLSYSLEVKQATLAILTLLVVITGAYLVYSLPIYNFYLPAFVVSLFLGAMGMYERQKKHYIDQLIYSQAEVKRIAAVAERERIGRDLHDVLGHTLTTITLKSSVAKKMLENGRTERVFDEVDAIEHTSRDAIRALQSVVTNYQDVPLQDELNHLVSLLEQMEIKVKLTNTINHKIDGEIGHTLSMIMRESVTNIIRHAQATHCEINISEEAKMIVYQISNNGDPVKNITFGNGLKGIKKRVMMLGGQMNFESIDQTHLTIHLPKMSP